AIEEVLPDAAGDLPDFLGLGPADERSLDVAAGVDEGWRAVAGAGVRTGALGVLQTAIDVEIGAGPGMADEAGESLCNRDGNKRIVRRQCHIGKEPRAVPPDPGADEAAQLKIEVFGDQRQRHRRAAAIAP